MEAATSYSSSSIARSSDAESSCMVGSSCEPVPLALARVDGTQLLLPFGLSLANDLSASSAHPARRSAREGDLRRWYRPRCRGGCTTAGPTRPRPHAGMFCPTRARVVFENFDGKNARRADLGGALHPPRRPHSGVRSESAARGSGRAGASNSSQTPASRIRPAYSLARSLVPSCPPRCRGSSWHTRRQSDCRSSSTLCDLPDGAPFHVRCRTCRGSCKTLVARPRAFTSLEISSFSAIHRDRSYWLVRHC